MRRTVSTDHAERAATMPGCPMDFEGTVVAGDQRGRTIGFPTANLKLDPTLAAPANGVYSAVVELADRTRYDAAVNIGVRPTIAAGGERLLEAHLVGYTGDLYGQRIRVELRHRLRSEMRFESLDALREQLRKDLVRVAELRAGTRPGAR